MDKGDRDKTYKKSIDKIKAEAEASERAVMAHIAALEYLEQNHGLDLDALTEIYGADVLNPTTPQGEKVLASLESLYGAIEANAKYVAIVEIASTPSTFGSRGGFDYSAATRVYTELDDTDIAVLPANRAHQNSPRMIVTKEPLHSFGDGHGLINGTEVGIAGKPKAHTWSRAHRPEGFVHVFSGETLQEITEAINTATEDTYGGPKTPSELYDLAITELKETITS